jgi:hypothetical protein
MLFLIRFRVQGLVQGLGFRDDQELLLEILRSTKKCWPMLFLIRSWRFSDQHAAVS